MLIDCRLNDDDDNVDYLKLNEIFKAFVIILEMGENNGNISFNCQLWVNVPASYIVLISEHTAHIMKEWMKVIIVAVGCCWW